MGLLYFVSFQDNEEPIFTTFPNDMIVNIETCESNSTETCVVQWMAPVVTDNSGTVTSVTSNYPSGYEFSLGITRVTFTALDPYTNSATASFVVTVIGK